MQIRLISVLSLIVVILALPGCQDFSELDPPSLDPGDLNPAKYVAIGNSLTAGYQNNAVYESSQIYSYPRLIADQLNIADFEQPLVENPGLPGRLAVASLEPFQIIQEEPNPTLLNKDLERPYNNLGIPGALLLDIADTTDFTRKSEDRNNPFFQIVLRDKQLGKSILEQALNQNPTILTLWLGNIDILGYVVSGGTQIPPTAQNTGIFQAIYNQLGGILAQYAVQTGAKIIIANIPDITIIPFVDTIPPYIINQATGEQVTNPETGEPIYLIGVQPEDKILLTALDYINQGYGIPEALGGNGVPIPSHTVLTVTEQEFARGRVNTFNTIIRDITTQYGFTLVDINERLRQIYENGYQLGNQLLTTDFVTGGLFSMDGVHPTTRGYGIVANEFIITMNQRYGANIPLVKIGALPSSIELVNQNSHDQITQQDQYKKLYQIDAGNFKSLIELYTNF
jgi:hypothetical protein